MLGRVGALGEAGYGTPCRMHAIKSRVNCTSCQILAKSRFLRSSCESDLAAGPFHLASPQKRDQPLST